jgi:plasmid stabilization system protein ParE
VARRPLEVLEAASNEALEAAEWYRERSEDIALAFVAEVRDALARIEEAPEAGPPHHHSGLQQTWYVRRTTKTATLSRASQRASSTSASLDNPLPHR